MSFDPRQVNVVLEDELMESCDQMVSHILIRRYPLVVRPASSPIASGSYELELGIV